jgi:hypothetical protein
MSGGEKGIFLSFMFIISIYVIYSIKTFFILDLPSNHPP